MLLRWLRANLIALCPIVIWAAVGLAYANHFDNDFHFDDFHTINNNVFIRNISNVPRFFTDPTTSSSLPGNRAWRPIVTTSLALDYQLGHGYAPVFFHISTFICFLAQLAFMGVFFSIVLRECWPDGAPEAAALFAVALYGLHPAMAETVNYIIQRAEVISTCGVVAGLAVYARSPHLRRYGLYLVPLAVAALAKPTALIFPALFFLYELLIEECDEALSWTRALRRALPSLALAAALGALHARMVPKSFVAGSLNRYAYLITQPYVAFRYFTTFFLPVHLTADTDLVAATSFWTLEAFGGALFVLLLIGVIIAAARRPLSRPIAFGLGWFIVALLPTSLFPLAEIENDHRMFFPFVGLALAVTAAGHLLLRPVTARGSRAFVAAALAGLLLVLALGTRRRNEVWRTEESLWEDVAWKSPTNGRGLMNYGLTQMAKGHTLRALAVFEQAATYSKDYPILEINLGIVNGALGRDMEAGAHFRRAIELSPNLAECYFYYARWLKEKGRVDESAANLKTAIQVNPEFIDARYLLLTLYSERHQETELRALADDTLRLAPGDETATKYLAAAAQPASKATAGSAALAVASGAGSSGSESPEALLELSLSRYMAHDYAGCRAAAERALRIRPGYAEAYNNIAAAWAAERQWDQAIANAESALRLKPDFPLARNNLIWAQSEKAKAAAQPGPGAAR